MINNTPPKKDIFANIATDLIVNNRLANPFTPVTDGKPSSDTKSGYELRQALTGGLGVEGSKLADSMELPTEEAGSDGVGSGSKESTGFAEYKGMRHIVNPVEYKAVFNESGECMGIARGRGHFDFAKEIADLTGLSINDAAAVVKSNPANVDNNPPNPDSGTSFNI